VESNTKIQLSAVEMDLVNNTSWIIAKHDIIKKVYVLFGDLSELMQRELEKPGNILPEKVNAKNAKISRGENYKLLPYVMLDYPAVFDKENVLAIRTMFWWGHFFSITLQVKGKFKPLAVDATALLAALQKDHLYVCVNNTEWEHHFEPDNYIEAQSISINEFKTIYARNFFKTGTKIPLTDWDNAVGFLMKNFRTMLQLLHANFLNGEKDLSPVFPIIGSDL
jgi:hypothetical protein